MPPKNVSTRLNPVRLNSITHLRVRQPNTNELTPCSAVMSAMLNCWASSGPKEGCVALEQQLRECMDTQVRITLIKSEYDIFFIIFSALPMFR
ncbi:hypothetical protein BDW62DRAFT_66802 [Aspergillus aurantiobrunneus]